MEVCSAEVCSAEVCSAEVCSVEVCSLEVCSVEVCFLVEYFFLQKRPQESDAPEPRFLVVLAAEPVSLCHEAHDITAIPGVGDFHQVEAGTAGF